MHRKKGFNSPHAKALDGLVQSQNDCPNNTNREQSLCLEHAENNSL